MSTALITGGAGRFGRAIARRLIAGGWFVVLGDLNGARAHDAAKKLGTGQAAGVALDVTDVAQVQAAVAAIVAAHGPIGALINTAGGRRGADAGPFTQSDPAQWRAIVDVHLRGTINACYAVVPGMVAAGRGGIVSLAAIEGLRGDPDGAVFSAAKAGVIVLTEMLVREYQPCGIRLNTIVPGNPQSLANTGTADDAEAAAETTAFLLSDAAAQTTGACIDVSGGWSLH